MTPEQITGDLYLPLGFQLEAAGLMAAGAKLLKVETSSARDYLRR